MRNVPLGFRSDSNNPLKELETTGSKIDMSFEYKPQEIEGLFNKDRNAQKVQQLAI
jgi:hypothetical protein